MRVVELRGIVIIYSLIYLAGFWMMPKKCILLTSFVY